MVLVNSTFNKIQSAPPPLSSCLVKKNPYLSYLLDYEEDTEKPKNNLRHDFGETCHCLSAVSLVSAYRECYDVFNVYST